jgi:hypothetical protein
VKRPSKEALAKVIAIAEPIERVAFAFAIRRGFAKAFAQIADADADAQNAIAELRTRVTALEHDHGRHWSAILDGYRPTSTIDELGQRPSTILNAHRPLTTIHDHGQVGSTTLD